MHLNELDDLYNVPEEIFNNLQPHQKQQLLQLWKNKRNETMKDKRQLDIYVAATYINCQLKWLNAYTGSNGIYTVLQILSSHGRGLIGWTIADCRLILTPLYKISDEHAHEIATLAGVYNDIISRSDHSVTIEGNNGRTGTDLKSRKVKVYFRPSNTSVFEGKFEVIEYCLPIFDYLRFHGYDCGYGEITSLIDAGIAIAAE